MNNKFLEEVDVYTALDSCFSMSNFAAKDLASVVLKVGYVALGSNRFTQLGQTSFAEQLLGDSVVELPCRELDHRVFD